MLASREEPKSLSITASTPTQVAILFFDDRDAAAANCHDHEPGIDQVLDGIRFDDTLGDGRSHHPPPAAPGIFDHGPFFLLGAFFG